MAILSFMTKSYAQNVYIFGNRTLSGGVPADYQEPVKNQAAAAYTDQQLKASLDAGYITEDEYNQTMNIKYPDWNSDPEPIEESFPTDVQPPIEAIPTE
ncbi:hypothetical protein ACN6MY_03785 [Peribacillus sp. B-H-3]|uniref:hypothetical protein n=1 Tax=Peribacillus sp. B-H-3 TaxID=3400420 RepID=UPI003B02414C